MYSLNPCLLIYPKLIDNKRHFIAEIDSSVAPLIIDSPLVVLSLNKLPQKFSKKQALKIFFESGIEFDLGKEILLFLCSNQIILNDSTLNKSYPAKQAWYKYGWAEAFKYHFATKNYPFLKMGEKDAFQKDTERMVRFKKSSPVPDIYQSFSSIRRVYLEKIEKDSNVNVLISDINKKEKRGIRALSLFFNLCFGERSKQEFGVQGNFLRKAIPSGGSRHPSEVFFFAFKNSPLQPGLYHYNVKKHSLDCLKEGNFYLECKKSTFDLFDKFPKKPLGLLVFTSLYERAMWRYRDSRSWRAPLIDVGHALMLYRELALALEFKTYTYQKFNDKELTDIIGIDPIKQTPLYIGTLI